jgi:NADH-quinone oxidoreductase subunit G
MELGMSNRGEHAEIETFVGSTINSELSGNMIDICPVGALTSKPFRYSARTWELSRRKSIAPHDSSGANLIVQVKNHEVLRVVPFENEAVNECWIADRDRFSYEALNSADRLTSPMIKQGGAWKEVDWQTALIYVANGVKQIRAEHGAKSIGTLVSPHSTLEEAHLATQLMAALGSPNVDHRLRNAQFGAFEGVRWLGRSIASLSELNTALVVGSNIRKEHPLFAQRIRQATRKGAVLATINAKAYDLAMPVAHQLLAPAAQWAYALSSVAAAIAQSKGLESPNNAGTVTPEAIEIARALQSGEQKAILLGNAVAHHAQAGTLLAIANWIGAQTGATVGFLTEAANTVGAQWVGALPGADGLNAAQMLAGGTKALFLLNTEPAQDSAAGAAATQALQACEMVVSLSPFKANMDIADVLLPIAPFTETSGSFVNAEGLVQGFHAVVKPLGETRPGWKVLRVLGNLLSVAGMDFESSQDVLAVATRSQSQVPAEQLSNSTKKNMAVSGPAAQEPVVASIYQLDGIVRRAPSLQMTADARQSSEVVAP